MLNQFFVDLPVGVVIASGTSGPTSGPPVSAIMAGVQLAGPGDITAPEAILNRLPPSDGITVQRCRLEGQSPADGRDVR